MLGRGVIAPACFAVLCPKALNGKATRLTYFGSLWNGRMFCFFYNAEKNVPKTSPEHAGNGYCGVEVEKSNIVASSCISIAYNEMPNNAKSAKIPTLPPRGIEPLLPD